MAFIELRAAAQQALEAQRALLSLVEDPCPYDAATTRAAARASITNLRAALAEPQEPDYCTWHQDGDSDSGLYATSCRHYFNLEDGTPEDNKMAWCCYCGKKLAQELIEEEDNA